MNKNLITGVLGTLVIAGGVYMAGKTVERRFQASNAALAEQIRIASDRSSAAVNGVNIVQTEVTKLQSGVATLQSGVAGLEDRMGDTEKYIGRDDINSHHVYCPGQPMTSITAKLGQLSALSTEHWYHRWWRRICHPFGGPTTPPPAQASN